MTGIKVVNPDGSGLTQVGGLAPSFPSWFPDGTRIAYFASISNVSDIFVIGVDGTGNTSVREDATLPAVSPDGARIAFTDLGFAREIYVMNANGSGETRLTDNPADDRYPAWSPDGTRIAFASNRDGNYEIYVMNADGSGQTRLTNDPGAETFPDWSPDGTRIAFTSDRDGPSTGIYVMNADGTGVVQIVAQGLHPDWNRAGGDPPPPPPASECSDGLDNDGDGKIDFPADPGCSSANDDDETDAPPPPPDPECSDGIDNDGDGETDFPADPGCSGDNDDDESDDPPPPPAGDTCEGHTRSSAGVIHVGNLNFGTPGDDVIVGTDIQEIILGLTGDDLICAGGGNDVIDGSYGDDRIFAGDGRDIVTGGPGADTLFGDDGDDRLDGGGALGSIPAPADEPGDVCVGGAGRTLSPAARPRRSNGTTPAGSDVEGAPPPGAPLLARNGPATDANPNTIRVSLT